MTTDESNKQEAPGVHTNETDEDDTEGHKTMHLTSDPDFASQAPSVHTNATPEEDDTEGHSKMH
jgi:hypothetical protein